MSCFETIWTCESQRCSHSGLFNLFICSTLKDGLYVHLLLLHCRNLTIITELLSITTPESLRELHSILFPVQIGLFQELSGWRTRWGRGQRNNYGKKRLTTGESARNKAACFGKEVEIFSERCGEKKKERENVRLLWFNKRQKKSC